PRGSLGEGPSPLEPDERLSKGMLDSLMRADRHVEDHALVRILDRPLQTPPTNADRLRGDDQPLRVQAVKESLSAAVAPADDPAVIELDVVKEDTPLVLEGRRLYSDLRSVDSRERKWQGEDHERACFTVSGDQQHRIGRFERRDVCLLATY